MIEEPSPVRTFVVRKIKVEMGVCQNPSCKRPEKLFAPKRSDQIWCSPECGARGRENRIKQIREKALRLRRDRPTYELNPST